MEFMHFKLLLLMMFDDGLDWGMRAIWEGY
jgi:hypothetical protein